MILVDTSSIFHRMIHSSVSNSNPRKENNLFITSDFINNTKRYIFEELLGIQNEYKSYGDMILCLDDFTKKYWRRDCFPMYKNYRKKIRDESEINYKEVFDEINEFINNIQCNLPWKVVSTPGAEADDTILVLAREYGSRGEKILIHSPDKDLIQAQIGNPNVKQFSALTKKWLVPENKHDSMDHWILEHVCLGDESDGVPKVVDGTEFSDSFVEHLYNNNVDEFFHSVSNFKDGPLDKDTKRKVLTTFDVWKTNRKGERTELDVYKDMRFGSITLNKIVTGVTYNKQLLDELKEKKSQAKLQRNTELVKDLDSQIKNFKPIEKTKDEFLNIWLDSHPLYRPHYERNYTLVMEQGIPNDIWNACLANYIEAEAKYNEKEFVKWLDDNHMSDLKQYCSNFKKEELTVENCGWNL